MKIPPRHSWDVTPAEARAMQAGLAEEVDTETPLGPWETVAAADVSFNRYETAIYGAVVVVRAGTFEVVERVGIASTMTFPYVPGLLSFREVPPLIEAFRKLKTRPDVVLCDGQGRAHPRRIGFASHLGLWLGIPTVGCAKSRLCGTFDEPGPNRGDRSPLVDKEEVVGAVLRTKNRVKPLFVSPGHLCDLESAVAVVMATTTRYRLPEPARMVHEYVNEVRRSAMAEAADTGPPE